MPEWLTSTLDSNEDPPHLRLVIAAQINKAVVKLSFDDLTTAGDNAAAADASDGTNNEVSCSIISTNLSLVLIGESTIYSHHITISSLITAV